MNTRETADLLSRNELFAALEPAALTTVAERAVPRTYEKGQIVCLQGARGEALYVVASGLVKIYVGSPDGTEMVLTTVDPPGMFGELSVLDGGPRSASAAAVQRSTLIAVTRSVLLEVAGEHPSMMEGLLHTLGAIVRRLTEQASDFVFLDLNRRIAKLLVSLAEQRGRYENGHPVLDLPLTQSDIGAMVGGSRQSVNQTLRVLERRGHIELRGRRIILLRPDLLSVEGGSR